MALIFQESITSESCSKSDEDASKSCNAIYKDALYPFGTMSASIGKRIELLINAAIPGGNQSVLARFVGVSPQAVQQWVAGETTPRGKNLAKIAEFFGVSPSIVQFGAGAQDVFELEKSRRGLVALRGEIMATHGIVDGLGADPDDQKTPEGLREVQEEIERVGRIIEVLSPSADTHISFVDAESNAMDAPRIGIRRRVPVVGTAQLGDDGYWAELQTPAGFGDGFVRFATRDDNTYALRCKGDSMRPRIKDGEFVIVEPNHAPCPGDEVLVKAKDGRVMVKELLYVRDDTVHLMSVNEAHPTVRIRLEEIDCMHFVVAIAKRAMWESD